MNDEEQKRFIRYLVKRLKELHHQKNVYLAVLQVAKNSGFPDNPDLPSVDELIENARQSPDIQAETDKRFSGFDKLIPPIPEPDEDEALRELIQRLGLGEGTQN